MPNKNPFYCDDLRFKNDETIAPSVNGQMKYVSGTGLQLYSEGSLVTVASGSATLYDDIGNPDGNGSIQFTSYTGTYTSTTANWGGLIISNTHANPTAGASLLNLDYTANGDANGVFIDCTDNAGADSKFLVGLEGATTIAGNATGTAALTLTAGDITMTAGDIDIAADNRRISFGASGDTDSYIYFDGAGNLTFFDSTVGAITLSQLESSSPTGDFTISDGQFSWTDTTDEVAGTWTFAGTTNNDLNWSSSVTTGQCLAITADALTTGDMLYLDSDGIASTAKYIRCYDGSANDFTVGAAGATVIAGSAAGTDAFTVTAGDLFFSDTDQSIMESENGTTTLLLLDNKAGVIASNEAVLHCDAGGNVAAGGNVLRLTAGGTPNAGAIGFEMDVQKDMIAVSIDTDAVTNDAFYVTHSGNLAAGKAVMHVTDGGTPAADNVYVGHFAFTGTATNESAVLFADGGGKDVVGCLIDCDPVYSAANNAGHLTLFSDAAGDLPVIMNMYHDDNGAASGEFCAKMFFYGHDDADAKELYGSIEVEMDDASAANPDGIVWIKGDLAGTNTNSAGFTGNTVMLGAAAATLTSAGAWDLTISTNLTAANEPKIVFTDGAAGNIDITAGGTSGEIDMNSPVAHTSTETITAGTGGALALTTSVSLLETDAGGDAYTLAAGVAGQIKFVSLITHGGGNGVLTLTGNPAAYDVITFTAVGQSACLVYTATGWMPISLQGCTIA
jgi:hypothetical protein